jgi:hypothetical protein
VFTTARHWTVPYHMPTIRFNIIRSSCLPVPSFQDLRPKILYTFLPSPLRVTCPPSPNPLDMMHNLHSIRCREKKLQSSSCSYFLQCPVTWYLSRTIFSTIRYNPCAMIRYNSAHLITLHNYKELKFTAQHNA